jgi:hypothetical protein
MVADRDSIKRILLFFFVGHGGVSRLLGEPAGTSRNC